jgi:hypothetical protein
MDKIQYLRRRLNLFGRDALNAMPRHMENRATISMFRRLH